MMARGLRVALAASLAATAWAALQPDDETVLPVSNAAAPARPRAAAARQAPGATGASARLVAWPASPLRDAQAWVPPDPRALVAWGPSVAAPVRSRGVAAPPAPSVPPEPEPPQAPPFPYALIGRVVNGDQVHALLTGATRTLGVKRGEVIEGQWRVDDIHADGVTLTWLPGGLRQRLGYRPT